MKMKKIRIYNARILRKFCGVNFGTSMTMSRHLAAAGWKELLPRDGSVTDMLSHLLGDANIPHCGGYSCPQFMNGEFIEGDYEGVLCQLENV